MRLAAFALVVVACGSPPAPATVASSLPAAATHRTITGPAFFALWLPSGEALDLRVTRPSGASTQIARTDADAWGPAAADPFSDYGALVPGEGPGRYRIELHYAHHDISDALDVDVTEATELVEVHADVRQGMGAIVVESTSAVVLTPHDVDGRVRFGLHNTGDRPIGPWFHGDLVRVSGDATAIGIDHSSCGSIAYDDPPPPIAIDDTTDIPLSLGGYYDTLPPADYIWIVDLGPDATRPLTETGRTSVSLRRAGVVAFSLDAPMSVTSD